MKITTEPFDPADYLTDPESISAYLTDALNDDEDPKEFPRALGDVARTCGGLEQLSEKTGIATGELVRIFSGQAALPLDTLFKITRALNLRLKAAPSAASDATSEPAAA